MSKLFADAIRRITELERRQSNLARIGTIAQADYARARVRVAIGKLRTAWLPWLTQHAGANARNWSAPAVGDQVVVLSPSGELATGVVLPALYCNAHPAPSDDASLHTIHFPDGAVITYDHNYHHLNADIPGSAAITTKADVTADIGGKLTATAIGPVSIDTKATAEVKAATAITLTAPAITLNGATLINGPLSQGTGAAGGAATMQGPLAVSNDVTAGGISLQGHTHGGVESGPSRTGTPS